ncbi:unnamed protein product [Caenorhabditis bovis]|uniref:non-specific serine/threonine protein kinase n=1 Tax=Caenorhabditis bovis TaxID=2654633 RepID=A0A8S1F4H6_9PELO|nr:unnamed protein product [Caenorhabditis bovis]
MDLIPLENTPVRRRITYRRLSVTIQIVTLVLFVLISPIASFEDSNAVYEDDEPTISSLASPMRRTYTNEWAIRIEGGSMKTADELAAKYGYKNLGAIIPGDEYFLFRDERRRSRSNRKTRSLSLNQLQHDHSVTWMEQQVAKRRVKRDYRKYRHVGNNDIFENDESQVSKSRNRKHPDPNDPLWTDMWYLNRRHGSDSTKMDHNVKEAWDLGYTGKGVVVTILDDGLERTHPDILPNYDVRASYDVNDRDNDPMPRYEYSDENRHGTRCAGEVAAIFNNSLCIVGIAYNANIGGIRMLDGDVTDAVEAASVGHNADYIDIYSASWGPDDDGRTVDGPAKLTKNAFERGITMGRKGKGSIFVWASGNGGKDMDSCNCDGYTNSIYTLSISSATEHGNIPWYSEACSSTLATTYSSGATGEKMIVTTDLHHACTNMHTGTSASAPLAAGIVALSLEANPNLTWRDLQHIVIRTAKPINLRAGDWTTNGVGRNVSHSFGYGLMDAGAMVKLAKVWKRVDVQHRCRQFYPSRYKTIPHGNRLQLQLYSDGCYGVGEDSTVNYVEHVQAIITLKAPKRGDLQIYLTSPSGTKSTLLTKRTRDNSRSGFTDWAFMTTHNWGEQAAGLWVLEIDNDGWDDAELVKWELVLYGTERETGDYGGEHTSPLAVRSVMLRRLPAQLLRTLSSQNVVPVRFNGVMKAFFDNEANFGKVELRPRHRPGRSWTEEELRLKSNSDLHKLWYVCLIERNMLYTMKKAYVAKARNMPNPERIDRVQETMDRIEAVVHERNDAVFRLETGEGASPRIRKVTSFAGFTYEKPASEHFQPADGTKEYEVPYLDDDAYMMQKLWNEKEYLKKIDAENDEKLRNSRTEDMVRFKRGAPRTEMFHQHGMTLDKTMEANAKQKTEGGERQKKSISDAAKTMALMYKQKLSDSHGPNQVAAARELSRYVNGDLKDENPKFIEHFLSTLDGKSDSALYNAVKSNSIDQKKCGIFLIVCLADPQAGGVMRYSNYLLKMLNVGGMDEDTVRMACRALAYLIQTSKSYAAELVDRSLDHCMEWLQVPDDPKSKDSVLIDNRRLAAAHLSRELALFTPTAFFLRASLFFKYIFNAIRDKNVVIRMAAIDALHAVLTITSQREAKQKIKWYTECLEEALRTQKDLMVRDESCRYHSVALVLNELFRLSDAKYENVRLESTKAEPVVVSVENPIDWLVLPRSMEVVESLTARQLVKEKFNEITKCVRVIIEYVAPRGKSSQGSQRTGMLANVLMQLLPRICAFPECEKSFHQLAFDTAFYTLQKNCMAAPALGLMMLSNPEIHAPHIPKVVDFVANAMKKMHESVADQFFAFLFLFVDAYGDKVELQIKSMLRTLLELPLSQGLTNVLKMIMMKITNLRLNVQDGVMASIYLNLTGVPVPSKSEPMSRPPAPRAILQKALTDPKELSKIVLSIETLGEFYFSRGALQRIMQYVADYYLVAESTEIRLAAVKCCCEMVIPFVSVYSKVTSDKRQHLLTTIHGVIRALVSVIVVDPHVKVRMQVITCFRDMHRDLMVHLAQSDMLEMHFMALHDEKLEMQQACVSLLGRLSELNPALVFPRMRKMLLETLSQLTNSGQAKLEQHSAKMIAQIATQCPKFLRPYIGSVISALIIKLRTEAKYADVTTHILHAIGEVSTVGGAEIVRNIDPLFAKLTHLITDSSHLQRREAALRTIGRVCRSTAYVVDPYRDYPTLLDDLLRLLKTVMSSSMRREAIKTLGILGAIDPYTHKVFTGSVQSAYAISTALSLPVSQGDPSDPRMDIIQWVNYEKCTLEEFYPAITIANLMMMIQDEAYSEYYREIAQAIVTIFRSLGGAAPQYVEQVIPRLIEVCRQMNAKKSNIGLREFFLRQLSVFVAIIKKHATPFMKDIFEIISNAWNDDDSLKMCVVAVMEEMGTALGPEFSAYTSELMPYLLHILQTDKSRDRGLTVKVLEVVKALCLCLVSHLHLVLPPILIILDDHTIELYVRMTALDTVLHMAQNMDVSAYAPRMMQSWHHCISVQELREKLLLLLIEIIKQLGKHFDVFRRSVDIKLRDNGLDRSENFEVYRKLAQRAEMFRDVPNMSLFAGNHSNSQSTQVLLQGGNAASIVFGNTGLQERLKHGSMESNASRNEMKDSELYGIEEETIPEQRKPTAARSTKEIMSVPISKQRLNKEALQMAWKVDPHSTSKEEWAQWLLKLRIAFLKSGSSPSLRAASSLGDQHPHLAKDLFPAAFMSVWTELEEVHQRELAQYLRKALDSEHSDVIQAILNLAEFMDHSEKGPLPIAYEVLGACAEKTKAYAKACRYKELQILKRWEANENEDRKLLVEDCQALITFANKLNVQEEAAGVVRYAERNRMNMMRGRWYEKLNEWEKALESYRSDPDQPDDVTMHEMRCLEALAHWDDLNKKTEPYTKDKTLPMDHKMAVIAARGAWAVGNYENMQSFVDRISENTQDGAMLRAVISLKKGDFTSTVNLIEKVRDMFDSELTTMANESYERAYTPMVFVQQIAELEEAIEYQTIQERRPRIALLWSRRLQGCRQNVEQWQRLLMLRSLVLSPTEMHPLRVKFASLCRKQGKTSMSRAVLRELLDLPPDANLLTASAPPEKPQLVIALCKQLWQDDHKEEALRTLEDLSKYIDRMYRPPKEPPKTIEAARICAKVFMKLGEWTEANIKSFRGRSHTITDYSNLQQMSPSLGRSRGELRDGCHPIDYYRSATEFDPKWHKAWHKLAIAYFYATVKDAPRRMNLGSTQSPKSPAVSQNRQNYQTPPPPPAPQMNPLSNIQTNGVNGAISDIPPPLGSLSQFNNQGPALISSGRSSPVFTQTGQSFGHLSPLTLPGNSIVENAINAIHCFLKALTFAPGSRLEDTLRLLQLWFDYGEHDEVYKKLADNVVDLPIATWLEVVPQLMARLDSSDEVKPVQLVIKVLAEISKAQPQSLIYALTVASRSSDRHRLKNAQTILAKMYEHHPKLVDECRMVSEELVRCAILWHEKWHDALDEASRVYFHRSLQDNNVQAMFETLRNLNTMMGCSVPKTMKEQSFTQTYLADLKEAARYCMAFERSGNVKDLNQSWEIYCQVFKRLRDQLSNLTSLDLNYVSPALMKAKDLQLAVPGTYDPSNPVVGISYFATKLTVITSKQRPRKMIIRGNNGLEYQFLLKGHEDPRQDERVMQLFGLVNTLLANNADTCRRNLAIQRYSIIALSKDSGLIGWVPNCDTLHSLVKEYREKKANIPLSAEHKVLQKLSADTEHLTLMQKLQLFENALAVTHGDDLRQILWLKSPSSEVWFDRRTNYTRSMACMSMVGYILGLGDRHPSNLMLDRLTGKIVHIDFGDCFEVAMLREKFPERVPFRLTRMLINAMEITGLEGVYRYTAERVLKVLRTNNESLLAVLEAFVYDPVINWRLVEGMKRDPKMRKDPSRMNTNQLPSSSRTEGTMDTIKRKLAGTEFVNCPLSENPEPIPVGEQLERLIEQATCHMNLCQSYIGWCPFW